MSKTPVNCTIDVELKEKAEAARVEFSEALALGVKIRLGESLDDTQGTIKKQAAAIQKLQAYILEIETERAKDHENEVFDRMEEDEKRCLNGDK